MQSNTAISAGQWWRLATPAFLHADIPHLACNSLALWGFGRHAERLFGPKKFLAVFAASNLAGFAASYRFTQHNSVGSSGRDQLSHLAIVQGNILSAEHIVE